MKTPLEAIPPSVRAAKLSHVRYKKVIGDWALPSIWTMKFRLINRKPFRYHSKNDPFCHRPWQVAPTDDMSPVLVIQKARQMGFTEIFINVLVHLASLVRCRTIYTMPKWPKAQEIAQTRIDPVGRPGHPNAFTGDVLDRLQAGWRAVMFKQIVPVIGGGTSEILITGSWNEDLGESTAADRVFLDEFDRMRPGVISAFRECLSSSRIKQLRVFSTPTFPKVGVDGQYQNSDKRRWMYKCPKCGHWQPLSSTNIVQRRGPTSLIQRLEAHDETAQVPDGTFAIACVKCQEDLDRWRAKCRWVAETRDAEVTGYKVSQLDCVWITADDMMRKMREYKPIGKWWNYVMGEAYLGDTAQLPENFVYQLLDSSISIYNRADFDRQYKNTKVSVGVDWGKSNWIFVLGQTPEHQNPILLSVYMVLDTDDPEDTVKAVVDIMKEWRADIGVADFGFGHDRNPKVYKAAPCMFWVCIYPPAGSKGATSEPLFGPVNPRGTTKHPFPVVSIGRAPSIKERLIELHNHRLTIPKLPDLEPTLDLIDLHFRNVAIVLEELADGTMVEVAQTIGPDHYLHAYNYAMIGLQWLNVHQLKVRELEGVPQSTGQAGPPTIGLPSGDDIVDIMSDYFDIF